MEIETRVALVTTTTHGDGRVDVIITPDDHLGLTVYERPGFVTTFRHATARRVRFDGEALVLLDERGSPVAVYAPGAWSRVVRTQPPAKDRERL